MRKYQNKSSYMMTTDDEILNSLYNYNKANQYANEIADYNDSPMAANIKNKFESDKNNA
jgi:hypothetical protein